MGGPYIPVVFFDPLLHRFVCFRDVDFAALAGNPVDNVIAFRRLNRMAFSTGWRLNKMLATYINNNCNTVYSYFKSMFV